MFENPRRGSQARNFTTNAPKILDLISSSEQIFSENCRWVPLNQFVVVVIVVVQWKAARCRIHLRPVMVRYGLAKLLRSVKALQTRKKSANGFENLLLHGLASHSER